MTVPIPDGRAWILPFILLLCGWATSAFVGYYHNDVSVSSRITAVETQQRIDSLNEKDRLDRIEDKLDRLFLVITGTKP